MTAKTKTKTYPKSNELIHKLTDGRRSQGTCLLSKKQSDWLRDVMAREGLFGIGSDCAARVGDFEVRSMGRAFSRNRNGGVIHVSHVEECCQIVRDRERAQNDLVDELIETYSAMQASGQPFDGMSTNLIARCLINKGA